MTLGEFRKSLRGFKPEAELVFVFDGIQARLGDVDYNDFELAGIVERNSVDTDNNEHPYLVIHFRRVDK